MVYGGNGEPPKFTCSEIQTTMDKIQPIAEIYYIEPTEESRKINPYLTGMYFKTSRGDVLAQQSTDFIETYSVLTKQNDD